MFFLIVSWAAKGQALPYKNPALPIDARINDLLHRMTKEEKFRQLFMVALDTDFDSVKFKNGIFGLQIKVDSANEQIQKINSVQKYFAEKTRLGIPAIFFGEALHGLVAEGSVSFPQSIALAAAFDTSLMHKVAHAIAAETKQYGIRQVLSPVVNIAGDVRWGRVEETYGEDVFLSSEMGTAFVEEFEKLNIITTPKHFIANVGDGGRDSYPVHADERTLNENYFPPFKTCVQRGKARSIMSSYNSLNGEACSMNNYLLNKKLKQEWKFSGFVISDAGAVGGANVLHNTSPDYPTSGKLAIENGLDVIFQTSVDHDTLFNKYFLDGSMDERIIDAAVARVLQAKFELGLFDHPYATIENTDFASHEQLAEEAAVKSIVLLKNKNHILPLGTSSAKTIAVIGKDAVECRLGGYSGAGRNKINMLEGLKSRCGKSIKINYVEGVSRDEKLFDIIPEKYLTDKNGEAGLVASFYNNTSLQGEPVLTRNEKQINFHYTFFSPDKKIKNDFFSAEFSGTIKSPKTGTFKIGLEGNDGYKMFIDDKLLIDRWQKISYHRTVADFHFEAGKTYNIRIEFYEPVGNAQLKLTWNVESENNSDRKIEEALQAAKSADLILVAAGIEEGEFRDRANLALPGRQEELIRRLRPLKKPIVVLLFGGSAITMSNWIDSADAILDVWYPGGQGGNAIVKILFGDENPSGKLPITFPLSEGQLPLVYNHQPTGRADDYLDLSGLPLFPFGFGLSYTEFEFSDLKVDKKIISQNESTRLHFKLKNTGTRDGAEVVQLYLNQPLSALTQPVLSLKNFQRIFLKAGETKELSIKISPGMLSHFNNNNEEIIEPGDYKIMIGSSSRDLRLKDVLHIK